MANDSIVKTESTEPKKSFKQKFVDLGQSIKKGFVNFGHGFMNFFKDPKTGFKKFWKFLRTQNGWLFILPAVILMGIFTFYPIVNSLVAAFKQNYNGINGKFTGWGFANFAKVIKSEVEGSGAEFVTCLENTLIFAFISVPLSTLLALLISVALNSIKGLQKAYQTVFFLPYLTNALAMGAVFATFFNIVGANPSDPSTYETAGLVNNVIHLFGGKPINWINMGSSSWNNRFVIIIYEIWAGLPFKILILFSSLQSVNKQYYDAAKIDGASKSRTLWHVTVPLISPMISYLIVTGLMGGLKAYSAIVGIFGESMGPNNDFEMGTMVGYIYSMIENSQTGYAAAGSLILFAIIMVFTALNLYVSKKKVHY